MFSDLRSHERSVYSQHGEDGSLERLFELIGARSRYFVEFGAKDGTTESNSANLRLNHGWSGLLMDAGAPEGDSLVRREFVTAENVNELFTAHGVPAEFDLLSIDIDGNDYWVWKAIDRFSPRVVIVEYNIFFGMDDCRTVPYEAERVWDNTVFHGASLAALRKLGESKGYALVHTDSWGPNALFVGRSELPGTFVERPTHELTDWNTFRGPPDPKGRPWVRV